MADDHVRRSVTTRVELSSTVVFARGLCRLVKQNKGTDKSNHTISE